MAAVSKTVLDALAVRLKDPQVGLNKQLAALCPLYGVETYQFDFSPQSLTFFYGRISPDLWEQLILPHAETSQQSILQYALITIDTIDDKDTALAMNASFAGECRFIIEATLNLNPSDIPQNLAYWANVLEDALIECIGNPDNNFTFVQAGMAFDRKVVINKSGWVSPGGENLRNTIQMIGRFNLVLA